MCNSFHKHHMTDDALAFTVFVDITFSHVNKFLLPRTRTRLGGLGGRYSCTGTHPSNVNTAHAKLIMSIAVSWLSSSRRNKQEAPQWDPIGAYSAYLLGDIHSLLCNVYRQLCFVSTAFVEVQPVEQKTLNCLADDVRKVITKEHWRTLCRISRVAFPSPVQEALNLWTLSPPHNASQYFGLRCRNVENRDKNTLSLLKLYILQRCVASRFSGYIHRRELYSFCSVGVLISSLRNWIGLFRPPAEWTRVMLSVMPRRMNISTWGRKEVARNWDKIEQIL
jgi:hypothetical protein